MKNDDLIRRLCEASEGSDLYDVTDHDGEFIHLEVEGRTQIGRAHV